MSEPKYKQKYDHLWGTFIGHFLGSDVWAVPRQDRIETMLICQYGDNLTEGIIQSITDFETDLVNVDRSITIGNVLDWHDARYHGDDHQLAMLIGYAVYCAKHRIYN